MMVEQRAAVSPPLDQFQTRVIYSPSWGATFGFAYLLAMRSTKDAILSLILGFIPLINIAVFIYYVAQGKRIAWRTRQWQDFQDFLNCQRIWDKWAKWVLAIAAVIGILAVIAEEVFSSGMF